MKPTRSHTIRVRAAAGDYFVVCRRGLLQNASREIARLGKFSSVHIVTSERVWRAVGKKLRQGIPASVAAKVHLFDDAEALKNLRTVEAVARKLVQAGADRSCGWRHTFWAPIKHTVVAKGRASRSGT